MKKPFLTYYEHLAKLSRIANKKTMFLMHLLHAMEFNNESKQNIVDLTARRKREIISKIGCESNSPLRLAENYLSVLVKEGLIKRIGGGAYLIAPESYSYGKGVSLELRNKSREIYETRIFFEDGSTKAEAYVILENGEKVELT